VAALNLFYSYSHEDEALRDQLEKHLRQLQRQGLVSAWHDGRILPGETWTREVEMHLETASIILLLVSPDFLGSDYCYDIQMQRALERHERGAARVVPIILRPCDWQHSPLKDLQCLPRDGKPVTQWQDLDEAFHAITQGLRRIIEQQQALTLPPVPLSSLDRQSRMRMLRQVRTIWIDGLLTQSLHRAAEIELRLQNRPDVLANPWRLQVQELDRDPQVLPDGTSIVQVYDRANGELLILGEPGAGKTTLLLELTRVLLERAENDERLPMPIVFHLSSWAEKRQSLRTWLVEELRTKYQVPRRIGQGWIDADRVLPLLDGLDEVAKDARSACVQQINDYYQSRLERGSSPIAICCRSEEYAALSTQVRLQHAVSILPLTDEQIDTYLEQAGEQVTGLKQALNEDSELHSLARQPLMLNIFTFAYQGARASEVPTGTKREEMQRTIFARYVEHMFKRRGLSIRWEPEQMIDRLTFLAKQMQQHEQTVFSVENLQPTWLSKRWRILYQWCVGLVIELLWGLVSVLIISQAFLPSVEPVAVPVVGLVVGLVIGLLVWLDTGINPTEALTWSWEKARLGLVVGLGGLLISVLVFALVGMLVVRQVGGLAVGLSSGLALGLVVWLAIVLSRGQFPQRLSLDPNEGIWRSGKNGLRFGLQGCLLFGLLFGLFFWLSYWLLYWPFSESFSGLLFELSLGLLEGLFLGLIVGLVVGLFFGIGAFVKHFILRFFLAWRGELPWNLVAFLDEAAERLLLRKVGGSYIFVHRTLQDYFAELGEKG
jgi:TIR domain/NACHT domain